MATSQGGSRRRKASGDASAAPAPADQNEGKQQQDEAATPEDKTDYSQIDFTLQALVTLVNSGTFEADVCLLVGGMIVTGTLTSGRRMLTEMAEQFTAGWDQNPDTPIPGEKAGPVRVWREYVEWAFPEPPAIPPILPGPLYLHLRDARLMAAGRAVATPSNPPGMSWRVKLSAVNGWSLGRLSADAE